MSKERKIKSILWTISNRNRKEYREGNIDVDIQSPLVILIFAVMLLRQVLNTDNEWSNAIIFLHSMHREECLII